MSLVSSIRTATALLVMVLGLISGCGEPASIDQNQQRPDSVPAQATFVGGADGGVYLVVRARDDHDYDIEVYWDTGPLIYRGRAKAVPPGARPVTAADAEGWNGEQIDLSTGGALVPVDTVGPIDVGPK